MTDDSRSPHHILYVDDEEKALQYFKECFEDEYVIHIANNAATGYELLEKHAGEIGVLITDQRMPGESGVELMERARKLNPNLVRILVTAYAEYQTAVDAVNSGRAFRYLHKPWDPEEIDGVLRQATDYYDALAERDRLLAEKAESIRHMLTADKVAGMGILAEGLNHHLRNALTVVRAFIDLAPMKLMEENDGLPPKDPVFWTEIQAQAGEQVQRIQNLLMKLAEASHAREVRRGHTLTLHEVLAEAHGMFLSSFQDKGITMTFDLAPNLCPIVVHNERFRQMWRLLFQEELTHLEHGDTMHIAARLEKDDADADILFMQVTDTGLWKEHDRDANLFDPFFTRSRKPDDFGVNMMACYVTMHLHGGTIDARHLDSRGLEITMRLPLQIPDKSATDKESTPDFFSQVEEHQRRWKQREEIPA